MKKIAGKVTDIDFFFTEEYLADMPYSPSLISYLSFISRFNASHRIKFSYIRILYMFVNICMHVFFCVIEGHLVDWLCS